MREKLTTMKLNLDQRCRPPSGISTQPKPDPKTDTKTENENQHANASPSGTRLSAKVGNNMHAATVIKAGSMPKAKQAPRKLAEHEKANHHVTAQPVSMAHHRIVTTCVGLSKEFDRNDGGDDSRTT